MTYENMARKLNASYTWFCAGHLNSDVTYLFIVNIMALFLTIFAKSPA